MTAPLAGPPAQVLVVGAGAGNLKSTVAVNLAAACAAAGVAAVLVDGDGASSRALALALDGTGGSEAAPAWTAHLPWAAVPLAVRTHPGLDGPAPVLPSDAALVLVDPPARLDGAVRAALAAARVVVVPVDASPLALRALAEVEAAVAALPAPRPRLRVVLARRLPRAVDRWTLVERIGELAPDALAPVTLPMGRGPRTGHGAAVLYAPGTLAARAYAALAADLGAVLAGAQGTTAESAELRPPRPRLTSTTP